MTASRGGTRLRSLFGAKRLELSLESFCSSPLELEQLVDVAWEDDSLDPGAILRGEISIEVA